MTSGRRPRATSATSTFRRPTEADHPRVVDVVDEWWGGRRVRHLLPRLWLEHFNGTSWIVERPDGRLAGFLVAFISQDDPDDGLRPHDRRRAEPPAPRAGPGPVRARLRRPGRAGARRVVGRDVARQPHSVAFHRALGFRVDDGPGTQRLYGTPAYVDHDGPGEDRVVFIRDL